MYKEAVTEREQAIKAWDRQVERESNAPLQRTVSLLDSVLEDLAQARGAQGLERLNIDKQRLKEVKRTFWGSGVMYPRSEAYKQNSVGMHVYSSLAGSADCTYWSSEAMYTEEKNNLGKMCMLAVDCDRSRAAEEIGYKAATAIMCGGDTDLAGLKNSLVIGMPQPGLVV